MKINSISSNDLDFPERLRDIPESPKQLYFIGQIPAYTVGVAIVGTRKPTSYGRQITADLAGRLAEQGAAIISGLAHGIDGIAHEASLRAGGANIAVLASGLDSIYPAANRDLARRSVEQGGAIVSEWTSGTPPLQYRFLRRNRIVTGLADAIVITEAGIRSGTMNTVSHALAQGRDVYAVPGPITSAMSAGCNALIAQGATPIVDIDSFIEHLFPKKTRKQAILLAQTEEEQLIMELIAGGICEGDDIQAQSKLEPTVYMQTLTMLEIRGAIRPLGANRWSL